MGLNEVIDLDAIEQQQVIQQQQQAAQVSEPANEIQAVDPHDVWDLYGHELKWGRLKEVNGKAIGCEVRQRMVDYINTIVIYEKGCGSFLKEHTGQSLVWKPVRLV